MQVFRLMSIVTTFSALASSSQARMWASRASESCVDTSSAGGELLRAPSSAVGILCWVSFRHQTRMGAADPAETIDPAGPLYATPLPGDSHPKDRRSDPPLSRPLRACQLGLARPAGTPPPVPQGR